MGPAAIEINNPPHFSAFSLDARGSIYWARELHRCLGALNAFSRPPRVLKVFDS